MTEADVDFPGQREYLGTVHTRDGEFKVYMPSLNDWLSLWDPNDTSFAYKLAAFCIGIEYSEFVNWGMGDVQKAIELLNEAIKVLGKNPKPM